MIFGFLCAKIHRSEKARCVLYSAGNHIAGQIAARTPNIKEDKDMDLVKALSSQYMKQELPEMRVGQSLNQIHIFVLLNIRRSYSVIIRRYGSRRRRGLTLISDRNNIAYILLEIKPYFGNFYIKTT